MNEKALNVDTLSPIGYEEMFSHEGFAFFIFRKMERITSALYLVSSLIPDHEPIKRRLCEEGLSAFETVLRSLEERDLGEAHKRRLLSRLAAVLGLIAVAEQTGVISAMNASTLNREYRVVAGVISRGDDFTRKETSLSSDYFSTPLPRVQSKGLNTHKGHSLKDISSNKSSTVLSNDSKGQRTSTTVEGERHKRRETILKVVDNRGSVALKDISESLPAYSGKTLQRELSLLVEEGILKREGERRWSIYSRV